MLNDKFIRESSDCTFYTREKNGKTTTICYMVNKFGRFYGTAKCPNNEYDMELGIKLSRMKALVKFKKEQIRFFKNIQKIKKEIDSTYGDIDTRIKVDEEKLKHIYENFRDVIRKIQLDEEIN